MKNKIFIISIISLLTVSCRDFFVLNISNKEVTILAPANNAVISNGLVQFWWEEMRDATQYRLQIVKPTFDSVVSLLADTLVSGTIFTLNLPAGNYQWRIAGVNSGYTSKYVIRSFQVDTGQTLTGKTVSIINPTNGAFFNTNNISFNWNALNGASFYRIQIDSNSIQKYEFTTTNTFYNQILAEGNWTWRIRAENGITISQYSNVNFIIDISGPSTPVLTAPANNATITQVETFNWQSDAGIAYDSIYIYSDASLMNRVVADRSITKSYVLIPFLSSGNYYWQVFSYDNAGNKSNSSNIFRFNL